MRNITQKDKRGLLIAFRVFLRAMSGERLSQQAGDVILTKALDAGLTYDAILNKENWGRALSVMAEPSAAEYIDILIERRIVVCELAEETMWNDVNNGFAIVAEAAHDYFMEVSGQGGKWNIPSALTNLAIAISRYSLQAILSEDLFNEVNAAAGEKQTFFNFIVAINKDFDTLHIGRTPEERLTEQQFARIREDEQAVADAVGKAKEEKEEENNPGEAGEDRQEMPDEPDDAPEDEPFPDMSEEADGAAFETTFIVQDNPRDLKRNCLQFVLLNYTSSEFGSLVETVEGGEGMTVNEIIDALTDGRFDTGKESAEGRAVHQNISADLLPSFIDCVRMQGVEMNEDIATNYDILKDNWDLRTTPVRKLHKLKRLIVTYGKDDPDLVAAIQDIESLYGD